MQGGGGGGRLWGTVGSKGRGQEGEGLHTLMGPLRLGMKH